MKPEAATATPNTKKATKTNCAQRLKEVLGKRPVFLKAKNVEDLKLPDQRSGVLPDGSASRAGSRPVNRGNTPSLLRIEIRA
jgi:hypothetical protein